jgi:hypothetical protein
MMNYASVLMLVVAWPVAALAQSGSAATRATSSVAAPYQPAVPPPSIVGAYGGWGTGGVTTAAGSAMNGMASAISARGDANLANSAAAMNLTQAQSQEIQNRQQATNTYFELRETNKAAQDAERGPNPTMQQLVSAAREGLPAALSPSQMDPVTGKVNWPDVLQADEFQSQRAQVDQLMAKLASHGSLSYTDRSSVRQVVEAMYHQMNAEIRQLTPQDYMTGRKFLNSLLYATTQNNLQ